MKRMNFGTVKTQLFKDIFILESTSKNKSEAVLFIDVIKNNPFLTVENFVYKSIENKFIKEENSAARFINSCVDLFKKYSKSDYQIAHEKLEQFKLNENIDVANKDLYVAIDNLIFETLKDDTIVPNIDILHESFEYILNYVTNNQKSTSVNESKFNKFKSLFPKETFLKKAIENYNQKFSNLNEKEKILVKNLATKSQQEKQTLFETLKGENNKLLKNKLAHSTNDIVTEKIKKSMDKIDKMNFDKKSANKDIINLENLKSNIKN